MDITKLVIPIRAEPFPCIINNSFSNGVVPDSPKITRVCPILLCGNKAEFTSYRLISIPPSVSKIVEKLCTTAYQITYQNAQC